MSKNGTAEEEFLNSPILVEFKAPKKLLEDFDSKWRSHFSSRSEAIRFLMRSFVEEGSRRSEVKDSRT